MPSLALLAAPKRINMAISAVASVKTSGVFVTIIFLFFAATISILPKPTAKLEIIFMLLESFEITSASIFSVRDESIPSQSLLFLIKSSFVITLSSLLNFTSKIFEAYSSLDLIKFSCN